MTLAQTLRRAAPRLGILDDPLLRVQPLSRGRRKAAWTTSWEIYRLEDEEGG